MDRLNDLGLLWNGRPFKGERETVRAVDHLFKHLKRIGETEIGASRGMGF
jgi:hypothetical protein